jgi:hypothetical protein
LAGGPPGWASSHAHESWVILDPNISLFMGFVGWVEWAGVQMRYLSLLSDPFHLCSLKYHNYQNLWNSLVLTPISMVLRTRLTVNICCKNQSTLIKWLERSDSVVFLSFLSV